MVFKLLNMKTAQIEEKPQILFVNFPKNIVFSLKKLLDHKLDGCDLQPEELDSDFVFKNYHKIVVLVQHSDLSFLKKIQKPLSLYQHRLVFVFPHLPNYQVLSSQAENTLFYEAWHKALLVQQETRRLIFQFFPIAQVVFFEGLTPALARHSPSLFSLSLIGVKMGVIYSLVEDHISIIDEHSFVVSLCKQIERPNQKINVLFRSSPISHTLFSKRLVVYHRALWQKELTVTQVALKTSENLEFSAAVCPIATELDELAKKLTRDGTILSFIKNSQSQELAADKTQDGGDKKSEFSTKLSSLFGVKRKNQQSAYFDKIVKVEKKERKRNLRRRFFFLGGVASGLVAVVLVILGASFYFFYQGLYKQTVDVAQEVLQNQTVNGDRLSGLEEQKTVVLTQTQKLQSLISHPVFDQASLVGLLIDNLGKHQSALMEYQQVKQSFYHQFFGQTPEVSKELFSSIGKKQQDLVSLKNEIYKNTSKLKEFEDKNAEYELNNKKAEQSLAIYSLFEPNLESILGFDGQKSYAFVIQDSNELRPTGGFIEVILLLKVKDGRMVSYQFLSSKQIDQMLLGVVTPPLEITEYLGEKEWYFHDSNWDGDFSASAKAMQWFIEKSLEEPLDGVFALSTSGLSELLAIFPSVKPVGYDEVGEFDLPASLAFYAKKEASGSSGYVQALVSSLFETVFAAQQEQLDEFLSVFVEQLTYGEIKMYFKDPLPQQLVVKAGWAGLIGQPQCLTQFAESACLADAVYQLETNVGVNKVNLDVNTTVKDEVELGENIVKRTRKVSWRNVSTSDLWPMGSYKAYMRFYLPENAFLDQLMLNKQELSSDRFKVFFEHNRMVVAFLLEVLPQTSADLELKYHLNYKFDEKASYVFVDQDQPGKNLDYQGLRLLYPATFSITRLTTKGTIEDGEVTYAFSPTQPRVMGVEFAKKVL